MNRTIETDETVEQTVAAFYDTLAPDYDDMTGFQKRFVHERPFFRLLVDRYGIKNAIDAGSGSGFHSLLLANLGVQVTAIDVSPEMIRLLKGHAKEMGLTVRAIESSFLSLPSVVHKKFDALFCMGNSLAHVLTRGELSDTLKSFAQVLKPGGILFMQNLNYDRILAHRESIQSVKEANGVTYVRYYEYKAETIQFHILKLKRKNTDIHHELNSVELRPIVEHELLELLSGAGFGDVKTFGGIAMEDFRPQTSKDLVVLTTRGA
jgi:glycine/sarcosine N-methyltransferase